MKKLSAGILYYRETPKGHEVLLVHPGGPFWAKKDKAAWSIPKGEYLEGEDPLVAAKREFNEETGGTPPADGYQDLGEIKQPSGKLVHIWAVQAEFNLDGFASNMFAMEWPLKSGKTQEFPECDKAAWFTMAAATEKLVKGQVTFLEKLAAELGVSLGKPLKNEPKEQTAQTSLF